MEFTRRKVFIGIIYSPTFVSLQPANALGFTKCCIYIFIYCFGFLPQTYCLPKVSYICCLFFFSNFFAHTLFLKHSHTVELSKTISARIQYTKLKFFSTNTTYICVPKVVQHQPALLNLLLLTQADAFNKFYKYF